MVELLVSWTPIAETLPAEAIGTGTVVQNLAFVLLFVLIGGFFAAAEIALVSLREAKVVSMAERSPRRGGRVVRLLANPNRLLAAVQVGVTLAGFVSAGFGAAQIAPSLEVRLVDWGLSPAVSAPAAFILVTVIIAYLSLVLGELVPKRMALQRAEGIAMFTAGPIDLVATLARPFIWLLSVSTDFVVRLLGGDPSIGKERMSGEELRLLVASHEELSEDERELIDDVFTAGDRELREVMVPRTEVEFLAEDTPVFRAAEHVSELPHSRYPVIRDSADDVVGFVHVRDLLAPAMANRGVRVGELVRDVARLPGSKQVLPALGELRRSGIHLAIVEDEYGGTDGIVTLEDLVEEIIGDIRDEFDEGRADEGEPGPTLSDTKAIDGLTNLEDLREETGIELPEGPYETVAGWLIASIGELPRIGDSASHEGYRFEVTELDGRRIDRISITPPRPAPDGGQSLVAG